MYTHVTILSFGLHAFRLIRPAGHILTPDRFGSREIGERGLQHPVSCTAVLRDRF
jgi:hypothetical protein